MRNWRGEKKALCVLEDSLFKMFFTCNFKLQFCNLKEGANTPLSSSF